MIGIPLDESEMFLPNILLTVFPSNQQGKLSKSNNDVKRCASISTGIHSIYQIITKRTMYKNVLLCLDQRLVLPTYDRLMG